jgi:hypothetical protein
MSPELSSSTMQPIIARYIIVLGRGLDINDGRYELTLASRCRVKALLDYVVDNAQFFMQRPAQVVFSGGWSEPLRGPIPPPVKYRESVLMLELAKKHVSSNVLGCYDFFAENRSRTTLENFLCTKEMYPIKGVIFSESNPLGLIAHPSHMKRAVYLAKKVYGLKRSAIETIDVKGDDRATFAPEPLIRLLTLIFCFGVSDPEKLVKRHQLMSSVVSHLRRLYKARFTQYSSE